MTDGLSDSSRAERKRRLRDERRGRYLDVLRDYLSAPEDAAYQRVLTAYAVCLGEDDGLSEGVAIKFGMMVAGLRKGDEKAWAKFLSIHVGFADAARLVAFKALSPFKDMIVVERDDHPDGRVTLCGEAGEFLRALEVDLVIRSPHYPISDLNKVKRSFVALELSETARNRKKT